MDSAIYQSHSLMTANAVAQINSFMDEVSERVKSYQGTGAYDDDGKITLGYTAGGLSYTQTGWTFGGDLVSVADSTTGSGTVYISDVKTEEI